MELLESILQTGELSKEYSFNCSLLQKHKNGCSSFYSKGDDILVYAPGNGVGSAPIAVFHGLRQQVFSLK